MLLLSLNSSNYFYVLSSVLCGDFSEHMLTDIRNSLWQCNFCGLINTTFLLDMSSWWWLILINILHTPVETITNVVKICLLHKTFICVTYKNVKKKHHDLFSVLHFFGWIHIAHGKIFYSYWKPNLSKRDASHLFFRLTHRPEASLWELICCILYATCLI